MSSRPHPIISYPCQVCGTLTSNWCSRCISVWYCTGDHLKQDWPNHRAYCTQARTSPSSPPSAILPSVPASSAQFSAFLFPSDEDRPRIARSSCLDAPKLTKETPITTQSCPSQLASDAWLPDGNASSVVLTQDLNGEPLRLPLHLFSIPDAQSTAPTEPCMQEALKAFALWFDTSEWCQYHRMEPRVGDLDCPVTAELYGIARQSFLTVFVSVLEAGNFGCRFEECFQFSTSTLDSAIKHQRQHHFDHRPFHCSACQKRFFSGKDLQTHFKRSHWSTLTHDDMAAIP